MNGVNLLLATGLFLGVTTGTSVEPTEPSPQHNSPYIENALSWLAKAQFENGGWGAGSHSRQDVLDPKAVQVDPATTALSAMALVRAGNTLKQGEYADNVRRAMNYLLEQVEASPEEGANITSLSGTQPQTKLGSNIDVSLCAQFFTRMLPHVGHKTALEKRVTEGLDKCLRKLQRGQNSDGSFAGGTWAGVLQSAMANSALELGQAAGREIDEDALARSKQYQQGNLDVSSGEVKTDAAAGVSLYALTGTQRATARDARKTEEILKEGKDRGILTGNAEPSVDNLIKAGTPRPEAEQLMKSYKQNQIGRQQIEDEQVLSGFGNNGGEEYLSHMMTSESLVITGGNDWLGWSQKMGRRFEKIQNPNGSWSGHHCITSPVFCTAAVVLAMTADRDADLLAGKKN